MPSNKFAVRWSPTGAQINCFIGRFPPAILVIFFFAIPITTKPAKRAIWRSGIIFVAFLIIFFTLLSSYSIFKRHFAKRKDNGLTKVRKFLIPVFRGWIVEG